MKILDPQFDFLLMTVLSISLLQLYKMQNTYKKIYKYYLNEIAIKDCHVYLGAEIDNNLKWSSHIQAISNKSTKVLNFIKRNLYNCPADTKRTAYLTLVRPIMEYAAPVWDP